MNKEAQATVSTMQYITYGMGRLEKSGYAQDLFNPDHMLVRMKPFGEILNSWLILHQPDTRLGRTDRLLQIHELEGMVYGGKKINGMTVGEVKRDFSRRAHRLMRKAVDAGIPLKLSDFEPDQPLNVSLFLKDKRARKILTSLAILRGEIFAYNYTVNSI